MREEVDRVLGGRTPTIDDLPKLAYTRMVIEEAMRLYPPVPGIGRQTIGGGRDRRLPIPPRTLVNDHRRGWCTATRSSGTTPERFDPERFTPSARRRAASLRLSSLQRRAAPLHRLRVRALRGAGDRGHDRAAAPGAAGRGARDRARNGAHDAAAGWRSRAARRTLTGRVGLAAGLRSARQRGGS